MRIEELLEKLTKFNVSFEIREGYYHVALKYPDNWEIVASDYDSIYIEKRNGLCHYFALVGSIDLEEIFNTIDASIKYNEDLERKLLLFRQKTEELQILFAQNSYEKLLRLKFSFPLSKKETKVKSGTEEKEKSTKKVTTKRKPPKQKEETPLKKDKEKEKSVENSKEITPSENKTPNPDELRMDDGMYFEELER